MGNKGDCAILKEDDIEGFIKYINDPNSITEEGKLAAVRAKKLAKRLSLKYI